MFSCCCSTFFVWFFFSLSGTYRLPLDELYSTTSSTSHTSALEQPSTPEQEPSARASSAATHPSDANNSSSSATAAQSSTSPQSSLVVVGSQANKPSDSVDVVAHSDFSLVSLCEFNIAPGQFRMALEEASNPAPVITHTDPSVIVQNGSQAGIAAHVDRLDQVQTANVPNEGESSQMIVHTTLPYVDQQQNSSVLEN